MSAAAWLLILNTAAFQGEPIDCFASKAVCTRAGIHLRRETFIPYGPPDVSVRCRLIPRNQCPGRRAVPRH